MYKILLDNGHETLGYTAGKMRRYRIKILPGRPGQRRALPVRPVARQDRLPPPLDGCFTSARSGALLRPHVACEHRRARGRRLALQRRLDRRLGALLIGGAVLAIANTIIKPILTLITLPIVILTLGLFLFVINVAMLALAEWIAPNFSIDGFWTYVGATIVVWLVNYVLHGVFGLREGSKAPRYAS